MKDLMTRLSGRYSESRHRAEARAKYYNDLAYSDKEYMSLDKSQREVQLKLYRAEFDKDSAGALKYRKEEERIVKLKKKRLDEMGIKEKDLVPAYSCPLCKDTGFIGMSPCKCLKENLLKLKMESFKSDRAFSSFEDESLLSEPSLKKNYEAMIKYCRSFPDNKYKTLLFTGKTGAGKTVLAECVADELLKKGYSVLFLTALELNDCFVKYHTFDPSGRDLFDSVTDCDLLIIDDLGTEPILNNVTINYLLGVIGQRQLNGKHTLITTNLNLNEILERYQERFFSRINDKSCCAAFSFKGEDLRMRKKLK